MPSGSGDVTFSSEVGLATKSSKSPRNPERLTVAAVAASIFRGPATEEIERALRLLADLVLLFPCGGAFRSLGEPLAKPVRGDSKPVLPPGTVCLRAPSPYGA